VTIEEAAVVEFARTNMANYKVPRHVVFVDSLPVNASGKVLKSELRERCADLDPSTRTRRPEAVS
jgi:acyl-CoA synthetase (AMP-forming)/AMP-acid ligase II